MGDADDHGTPAKGDNRKQPQPPPPTTEDDDSMMLISSAEASGNLSPDDGEEQQEELTKKQKLNNNGSEEQPQRADTHVPASVPVDVPTTASSTTTDTVNEQHQTPHHHNNNQKNNEAEAGGPAARHPYHATGTSEGGPVHHFSSSSPAAHEQHQEPDSTTSSSSTTTAAVPTHVAGSPPLPPPAPEAALPPPPQTFKTVVMYNKNPITVELHSAMTVLELKKLVEAHTGVDPNLQKVLLKGIAKDDSVLGDLGVGPATKKILVIGSSIQEIIRVKEVPSPGGAGASAPGSSEKDEPANWCSANNHKKVIDKGLPDDVMPGILGEHDPLPPFPLHGMYSNKGSKVRLTFKLESDELWIGTKERTEKVPIGTIRNVESQPITGYEHYHIVAIQLGPTEASRFFVYWVPAQYVESMKDALTGG